MAHTNPCFCPQTEDAVDCYLWIYPDNERGCMITFPSLTAAYNHAQNFIGDDDASSWIKDSTLCEVRTMTGPQPMAIFTSTICQLLIGIGSDLTPEDRWNFCRTYGYNIIRSEDSPDTPPVLWMPPRLDLSDGHESRAPSPNLRPTTPETSPHIRAPEDSQEQPQ